MKKIGSFLFILVMSAAVFLPVSKAYATSASVSVSPTSSSVTKGNSVTVQVRVNSASGYDSAQATLNFDSSKLQYASYSNGAFTPAPAPSISGSSVRYSGTILGGEISGNQLLFSVTFNTVASGTTGLSLSSVRVLKAGADFAVSVSNGSVAVSEPSSTTAPPSSGSKPKTSTSKPASPTAEATDTEPPVLVSEPRIDKTQTAITITFTTDEASTATISYAPEGSEAKTAGSAESKTEHQIILGKDDPLQPGLTYKLDLVLNDAAGNASPALSYSVRTKGVGYKVKVVDADGTPLRNHPVELHSDPIQATTDENGIATFTDVTPGEHTLVVAIEGIEVRQPVNVGNQIMPLDGEDDVQTIKMPFRLGTTIVAPATRPLWLLVVMSFGLGIVLAKFGKLAPLKSGVSWVMGRLRPRLKKKSKDAHATQP